MTEAENVLDIRGLSFAINQTPILEGIDLRVQKGAFVGLIGPNGAGKTTLLKCINGINKADGTVSVKGKSIRAMSEKEIAREIAVMHQDISITFPFPALDVVMMGRYPHMRRMRGETQEDYRVSRENMDYTGTLDFARKPITEISGGERQRVIFAKALTQQTEILLLDEPTASLDITHQEQIFKYSKALCSEGKTVIAAVHDLRIAARYCDRLVLMKAGRIIADGTPERVLTSENILAAYGVNALVYKNTTTGMTDLYISERRSRVSGGRAHIIGGGGSASGVIRHLFECGYQLSAGVFNHGDSDLNCAEVFGIDTVAAEPFCEIGDAVLAENIEKIKAADVTVLCSMPFGAQNLRNLEAAKSAKKLLMIEDDPPQTRDFTGGAALALYGALKERAVVTTSAMLHEVL